MEATLSQEVYEHEEDFFFRTVHLGTECWSFVALDRMAAAQQLAEEGQWHVAAARIIQVSLEHFCPALPHFPAPALVPVAVMHMHRPQVCGQQVDRPNRRV